MADDNRIIDIDVDDLKNLAPIENNQPYEYMILEGYKTMKEETETKIRKFIHVLKFTKENAIAKVGRGSAADIKIIHSTVSRVHSIISFHGDQMYIRDAESKFGTLVFAPKPFELKPNVENYIQVGRVLMNICLITHKWK